MHIEPLPDRPSTLAELLAIKAAKPHAKLLVGNTELGVDKRLKHIYHETLVYSANIPELLVLEHREDRVVVGASCTIAAVADFLQQLVAKVPEHQVRG